MAEKKKQPSRGYGMFGALTPQPISGMFDAVSAPMGGGLLGLDFQAGDTGQLRAHEPSLRESIAWGMGSGAEALGASRQGQQRVIDATKGILDWIPGLGDAVGLNEAKRDFDAGNYGSAAVNAGASAVGMVPVGGDIAAGALKAIFAGPAAKTADLAKLKRAEAMEGTGSDATSIWNDTGWFRGADGKWRFEIDDLNAQISPRVAEGFASRSVGDQVPVENADRFLDHPELFEAYPDLWRVNTRLSKGGGYPYQPSGAYFTRQSGTENIAVDANTLPQAKSLTLHELMHAIQEREDFARGADLHEVGMDEYARSAGEVEANNVQRRMWMNADERKRSPPFVTEQENVPRARQIVKFKREAR